MTSMHCESCGGDVESGAHSCPSCGWQFPVAHPKTAPIITLAVRPKQQVGVELALVIDRTGSILRFAKGVCRTVKEILKMIEAKVREVKAWLFSHGDLDEHQDTLLLVDGGTTDQAIEEVDKITYGGGGDPKEHHLDAIEHVVHTVPWSLDPLHSRGVIIAMLTADSKPARSGVTARELGERIKSKGLLLYLICEPTPTLRELCDAAGGFMYPITNDPDPADLQRIASAVGKSITIHASRRDTVPFSKAATVK